MGQTLRKEPQPANEPFVQLRPRDNFYQSVSFFPMPFAMITTINERGTTSIGPHSLVFPFDISESHSMMLVSRASSNTATNLRRTGKCALNFIDCPFELEQSPHPTLGNDPDYPLIMKDAFQVYECVVDGTFEYHPHREAAAPLVEGFFALQIENVLLKESFKKKLDSRQDFPDMPLSYGFRGGGEFWFAKHEQPFYFPVPRNKGDSHRHIYYMANKVDPDIRFSEDACLELTSVPKVFLDVVLDGLLAEARSESVHMIDKQFVKAVEARRARN